MKEGHNKLETKFRIPEEWVDKMIRRVINDGVAYFDTLIKFKEDMIIIERFDCIYTPYMIEGESRIYKRIYSNPIVSVYNMDELMDLYVKWINGEKHPDLYFFEYLILTHLATHAMFLAENYQGELHFPHIVHEFEFEENVYDLYDICELLAKKLVII